MQTQNRFFDDIARLLGGAAAALSGVRNEMETLFRQQIERLLANMELVGRDEFDVLHAMVQTARDGQENMERHFASLGRGGHRRKTSRPAQRPRHASANLRRAARRHKNEGKGAKPPMPLK